MSRRRRDPLTPDDRALWESVARTVRPMADRNRREEETTPADSARAGRPPPQPQLPAIPPTAAAAGSDRRPQAGIDRRRRRDLARGRMPIDSRIDLHGLTQERAHHRLLAHLAAASARGERCVLVITGKGGRRFGRRGEIPPEFRRREDFGFGSGVLRRAVPHWLDAPPLASLVQAYAPADARHGGEGALYVLLRRRR